VRLPFALRSFTRNALYALRRLGRTSGGKDATGTLAYPYGIIRENDGRDVRMYFEYKSHRLSPREIGDLGVVRQVLGEAGDLCRRQGARFLVVFVPSKDRVYLDRARFAPGAEPLHWERNDLPDRLAAAVRQADPDAGFLDLTPVFRQRAARGGGSVFPSGHPLVSPRPRHRGGRHRRAPWAMSSSWTANGLGDTPTDPDGPRASKKCPPAPAGVFCLTLSASCMLECT
jgi:hypothetical protein